MAYHGHFTDESQWQNHRKEGGVVISSYFGSMFTSKKMHEINKKGGGLQFSESITH